ncbi:MAG: metallopeptidase family protein [Patescibacteria group bacterium]|nr:metallopeptidase family protein [Patescibacteria group bacterium]
MRISREQFEKLVAEAMDSLPEEVRKKINNVAVFVEEQPTKQQLGKAGRGERDYMLFGLFEGYAQAQRINFGPVLPDRITIFRGPICQYAKSKAEIKKQVISTVKHEIAHHFGSDEAGAQKASKK